MTLDEYLKSKIDNDYVRDCLLLHRTINMARAFGILGADPDYEPIEYLTGERRVAAAGDYEGEIVTPAFVELLNACKLARLELVMAMDQSCTGCGGGRFEDPDKRIEEIHAIMDAAIKSGENALKEKA